MAVVCGCCPVVFVSWFFAVVVDDNCSVVLSFVCAFFCCVLVVGSFGFGFLFILQKSPIFIVGVSSALDSHIKVWNLDEGTMVKDIQAPPGIISHPLNPFFFFCKAVGSSKLTTAAGSKQQ